MEIYLAYIGEIRARRFCYAILAVEVFIYPTRGKDNLWNFKLINEF